MAAVHRPQRAHQRRLRQVGDVPHRAHAQALQLARVAGPTPHRARAGSGRRKPSSSGRHHPDAGAGDRPGGRGRGLGRLRGQLGHHLGGGDAHRAGEALPLLDLGRMARPIAAPSPNRRRAPVTSRNASSRLSGSTSGVLERKMSMTPCADLAVVVVVAGQEHRLGAEAAGLGAGHGREHAVGPGLVAGRGPPRPAGRCRRPPRAGPAARAGAAAPRTRRSVHVHVQDGAVAAATPRSRSPAGRRPPVPDRLRR